MTARFTKTGCHLRGCTAIDDLSPSATPFGAHIDQIVGIGYHIHIVFDHYHTVAEIDEVVQDCRQSIDIREMESGGGFVEYIECPARIPPAQLSGEFDSLCLTSGECGRILPQSDIGSWRLMESTPPSSVL